MITRQIVVLLELVLGLKMAGSRGLQRGVSKGANMVYANSKAVFWPDEPFDKDTTFAATVTAEAESAAGIPMAADHRWLFATAEEATRC